MKMTNKKKVLILVGMFALLVVTAVLNYVIAANVGKSDGGDVIQTGTYFSNWRSERATTRDNEIAYLDTIIDNTSPEYVDARAAAMEQKQKIIKNMDHELTLEYTIKTAGYEEVAVSVNSVSGIIYVVVQAEEELTKSQVANIYSLVFEETAVEPDFVRIIPI